MGSERAGEPLGQAGPTRRAQGLPRGSTAQPGPERRHRPAARDTDATATGPPPCGSPPSPPASRHRALKGELCAHPLPVTTVGTGTGRCRRRRGHARRELLSQCGVDVAQALDPCVQRAQGRVPAPPHHPPEDGDRAGTSAQGTGRASETLGTNADAAPSPHGRRGVGPGGSTPRGARGGLTDTEGRGPEGALPAGLRVAAGTASRQGSQGAPCESWGQTTGGGGGGRRGQALGAALRSGPASSV